MLCSAPEARRILTSEHGPGAAKGSSREGAWLRRSDGASFRRLWIGQGRCYKAGHVELRGRTTPSRRHP
jgi:hypothetical protein